MFIRAVPLNLKTVLWLCALTIPCILNAQEQRMAIPPGVFHVGVGATLAIDAYCVDYGRANPKPSSQYGTVLAGSQTSKVTVGGKELSLTEALAAHLIEIKGRKLTFGEFLMALSSPEIQRSRDRSEREEFKEIISLWKDATPKEKEEVNRKYAGLVPDIGSYSDLQLVNTSHSEVKLVFSDPTIVSVRDESISDVDLKVLDVLRSKSEQPIKQAVLWRSVTSSHQRSLKSLGYYSGVVDGVVGPQTESAIRRFQKDKGLTITNQFDANTAALLNKLTSENTSDKTGSEN
jgi:hypothetical protein